MEKAAEGQPAAAGGPAPKPGSLASSEKLIRSFLKQKGVVETDKGTKFKTRTLNFSFDDMVADLTKNGQYRNLSELSGPSTSHASSPPAYETPPPGIVTAQPVFPDYPLTPMSKKGKPRPYM
ncbi:Hypothetical predicted protein [Paramuricea clavata]|uniref:Uncharacterized protein n=1 Tax=Paramuricea clavata TaxID=317549 RepID=A0A6S7FPM1_PARCT|nr:Hypothetical predicted protein [Paramuricea clavata]